MNRSKNFTCAKRKVFDASKNINPGPGQYRVPSAFGHYMDSNEI